MQEEYRRYQRIEQDLMQHIYTVERAIAQLKLIPEGDYGQLQEQVNSIAMLRTTIRATILTAEEILTPAQLHSLQRRVNVHNPNRWQHYRDYKQSL